jgi:hypothetical protein
MFDRLTDFKNACKERKTTESEGVLSLFTIDEETTADTDTKLIDVFIDYAKECNDLLI